MSYFESIAIGEGCVLPGGCFSPALISKLANNQSVISEPEPSYWRLDLYNDAEASGREKGLNSILHRRSMI